ncbi:NAD(P)-binding protein [Xylaria cubensis]|nr:NAD(P)-binding protein [Xylaria cubensis]
MDLDGFSLVIGGGNGIGQACALAFSKAGTRGVMVADIDLEKAKAVVAECKRVSTRSEFRADVIHVDVTLESSVQGAIAHTVATFKRIDYCIVSAGIGVRDAKEMSDADTAEFSRFFQVNVQGTFFVVREVSAAMKLQEPKANDNVSGKRGYSRGTIVILGSVASFLSQPRQVQYTASKHAVLGIARNAALDNIAYDIRVNCLCPSWVDTQMVRHALDTVPGLQRMIEGAVPMGRLAQPEEIADTAMFLCSPNSSYITGSSFIVDGGTTLTCGL